MGRLSGETYQTSPRLASCQCRDRRGTLVFGRMETSARGGAGSCVLYQHLPSALHIIFCSSASRSATTLAINLLEPTGVPKIFTPFGLQTPGPNSTICSEHPALFHTQVCPSWRRNRATLDNVSCLQIEQGPHTVRQTHDLHMQTSKRQLAILQVAMDIRGGVVDC